MQLLLISRNNYYGIESRPIRMVFSTASKARCLRPCLHSVFIFINLFLQKDSKNLRVGELYDGQSEFDPFEPDYSSFPLSRASSPHVIVLKPGDVLLIPPHWTYSALTLSSPSLTAIGDFNPNGKSKNIFLLGNRYQILAY